jgi:1-phosphofructokinase family hexose kinase
MILAITMNPAIDKIYFVENYQLGEVHRPSDMIASAGGKGLNVARVAKLVGANVAASGLLGGANGSFIESKVKELKIESQFFRIAGETRICINVTDTESQQCTEVLEAGPTVSEKECVDYLVFYESLLDTVDVVTLSGSLPQGIPSDYYAKLIAIAKAHGKKVLLDSSGSAFAEGLKEKPYLIKPNTDEIKVFYNGDTTTLDGLVNAIRHFKAYGIELPIISRGKDGSLAGLSDGIYQMTIPPVTVINSVGSGDSFIAGCAVGLSQGLSEHDAIKLATACGTANTQFSGTGVVTQEKVDAYFEVVSIEKIANY